MENRYSRTEKLIGNEGVDKLKSASVLVMGCGGVGSYAAEAVARAGVGRITLMDGDDAADSNLNRQLVALTSTIGRNKAEIMGERCRDINPDAEITAVPQFYKTGEELDISEFDWIIDAIDDVDAKVLLIKEARDKGVNIISSMGAAGKFETHFITADISETSVCPLAKVMRKRLRDIGIEHVTVVYSKEKPVPRDGVLGTMSYVPGSCGLELAGHVIKEIAGVK